MSSRTRCGRVVGKDIQCIGALSMRAEEHACFSGNSLYRFSRGPNTFSEPHADVMKLNSILDSIWSSWPPRPPSPWRRLVGFQDDHAGCGCLSCTVCSHPDTSATTTRDHEQRVSRNDERVSKGVSYQPYTCYHTNHP